MSTTFFRDVFSATSRKNDLPLVAELVSFSVQLATTKLGLDTRTPPTGYEPYIYYFLKSDKRSGFPCLDKICSSA
jgi:hypothetical protein